MVVVVKEIAGSADTADEGARVAAVLKRQLRETGEVTLSFAGLQTVTSSFLNTAIVPLISEFSLDYFKTHVRVVSSTRQINEMIKKRFEDRSQSFWWGRNRITERDLRLPALQAMAARPEGFITTVDLIEELQKRFNPQGEDALLLQSRKDSRFSQIVRNLKSHKSSSTSIFARGYAVDLDDGMKITDAGRAYLVRLEKK